MRKKIELPKKKYHAPRHKVSGQSTLPECDGAAQFASEFDAADVIPWRDFSFSIEQFLDSSTCLFYSERGKIFCFT